MSIDHVLIIDDNPADLELAEIALEESGAALRITTERSAARVLQWYANRAQAELELGFPFSPDLVFVDLKMPAVDGFTFLERVKENLFEHEQARFAILSSADRILERQRALRDPNVIDYLLKPPSAHRMRQTIARVQQSMVYAKSA